MKLTDYYGEDAIDLLADMLEPITEILTDQRIADAVNVGEGRLTIVRKLMKWHKKEILHIMALSEGKDAETYSPNFFALPVKLIELFSQPEMQMLFSSQEQMNVSESSGTATEITTGQEDQ